jgi:hypothetical protein
LLFSMMLYLSVFDVRRIVRDVRERPAEAPAATAPAQPAGELSAEVPKK